MSERRLWGASIEPLSDGKRGEVWRRRRGKQSQADSCTRRETPGTLEATDDGCRRRAGRRVGHTNQIRHRPRTMNAALATTFLLLAPSAYAASTSQRQHHLAPDNECNLCSRNVTLLLATGRSGSTSLLEAINSLPGVALRGESDALSSARGTSTAAPFDRTSPPTSLRP